MSEDHDRRLKIILMALEKASKGKKISRSNIQKLLEASRTHIAFNDMVNSCNELLDDVFGLQLRPIAEQQSNDFIVVSKFAPLFSEHDADHVRIIDFIRFPIISMITACINHSPLGKVDLAELKSTMGESMIISEICQETGLTVDKLVKDLIDGGYFVVEDDPRGSQALVKGHRLRAEAVDEMLLETQFQEMLDRLRQSGDLIEQRRPSPLGANTSA